jgi:hypothetical protein
LHGVLIIRRGRVARYGNERVEERKFEFIHQLVLFRRVPDYRRVDCVSPEDRFEGASIDGVISTYSFAALVMVMF